ncbi:MAG TPA: large-conductance mechanosensitive channel protein MscL [Chitinophagaceae bacterium]|nr:large-conductance mechanosensitive channel protein MscL [Chitinophagaceae bacterium]HNF72208.1 large-conductance mechanosensitive channel protein MscL [Chitinophagaceae bacterium]
MSFIKEFKAFAIQGNLVDMAIGVVMGTAFGKVVSAFIDGMVMPAVGMLTGGVNFNEMKWILKQGVAASKGENGTEIAAVPEVAVHWGNFITVGIEFLIIALVVFQVIKIINRMKRKEAEAAATPPAPSASEVLLTEIRDALRK